ncbi:Cof subfamily protein (haloacid dehalogenase superfamily) [Alkalibacillus flavidus]|uniref:Cof subfamily protein (Haloacid dehalogenase superfamily) n=1 Tax=Alkalibacillus flavidus TaxID=546021 RepID=A0ABV2KUA6_9BACI
MEQHIIFFDLDGTLLNSSKQVPESAVKAVQTLKDNGHIVAIATGRAPFMYEHIRKQLGIETYVSFNGQYAVSNGEAVYRHALNPDSLHHLVEHAVGNDHPVVYLDHENMKANVQSSVFVSESMATLKLGQTADYDPAYKDRDIYQALLFCEDGEEKEYVERYPDFDFMRWHAYSVDVIPSGGSKAEGIGYVLEDVGLPRDRVVVFGDSINDLEMLSSFDQSVAMGNGHDRAKEAANYVTAEADHDGIKQGLERLGLI